MMPNKRIFLSSATIGIGDLIVILPILQTLIDAGCNTHLVARTKEHSAIAERVHGLAGCILLDDFHPADLGDADEYFDLRDHPLQTDYWWGSREFFQAFPGWRINDILAQICKDKGLAADFTRLRPLHHTPVPAARDKIVFVPGSAHSMKCWPFDHWLGLAELLQKAGYEILVVGQPDKARIVHQLISAGLTWYPTRDMGEAIDLLSSCLATVAVDTGLMHIAAHQGTPTLSLYRYKPVFERKFPHVAALIAAMPCADICYEQEINAGRSSLKIEDGTFCPDDLFCLAEKENCLGRILPSLVFAELQALLVRTIDQGTSLHPDKCTVR